jgi:predicted dehydrogenase
MEKTRIGLIGCGGIAEFHVSHLIEMDDVQIVSVADPVEERRVKMAAKVGATRVCKDHAELYDHAREDALDAVYVCIEPTAHTDTELRAIELNLPFLVEKPMTLDLALADKIAALIAEKNLITAVGFQDRYLDLIDIVKAELPKHKPGGLVYGAWIGGIPDVWWWMKHETCGGQLVEQNIHLLDGLRYLFGEPLSVYATRSRGMLTAGVDAPEAYANDDHSTAVIRFENEVTATLVSACYVPKVRAHSGLVVTLGDMILDYRLRNNLIIRTETETRDILRGNDQGFDEDRTFIDAVQSGCGAKIRSPYADALKTLKLGFAANESMETGKVITF